MAGADRFAADPGRYDRARPSYPQVHLATLAGVLEGGPGGLVVDVGAGTGVFTRQLVKALPGRKVIGVEPSAPMRTQGVARHGPEMLQGSAEALPFADSTAAAVTAAAAAHWFDRDRFYPEVERVLAPGGVLAILDYPRDLEGSPAARAAQEYLDAHGDGRAYVRPDYVAELAGRDAFRGVTLDERRVEERLTPEQLMDRVLSSSHARAVEWNLGQAEARRRLGDLADSLREGDGRIPYAHRFRLVLTFRK